MYTTPVAKDAVPACPPLGPVGPVPSGFFADCSPADNFEGTRPIAAYFNELILNLRELLRWAKQFDQGNYWAVPIKGDPTMLRQSVVRAPVITWPLTQVWVRNGGYPDPADPFVGQPFDSLSSALRWLARYRIATGCVLEIILSG